MCLLSQRSVCLLRRGSVRGDTVEGELYSFRMM